MQPSPIADTSNPLFPSLRFCTVSPFNRSTNVILSEAKNLGSFVHRDPGSKDRDVSHRSTSQTIYAMYSGCIVLIIPISEKPCRWRGDTPHPLLAVSRSLR